MDGELKKEQIDTLFVHVGLLQGEFWGGWFRGGPTNFLRGVPLLFFALLLLLRFCMYHGIA